MKRHGSQRGQTLPLVAMGALILIGAAGLAVDTGYHQYQQRLEQTAADSAALTGAAEKLGGKNFAQAAKDDASLNGFTDDAIAGGSCTKVCVQVNNPPSAQSTFHSDSNAVEVIITALHPTFFESVFGINNVPVTTRAVATITTANDNGCVVMLDPSANTNFNKDSVTAATCGIVINGTANFNGATVSAQSLDCVSTCSGGNLTLDGNSGASPTPIVKQPDPCLSIASCAFLTNNPPSTSCTTTGSFGSGQTAAPGCYGTLNLSGNVALGPGLYVITGALNAGNATVTAPPSGSPSGTGVTIYLGSSASMNLNKATMNLAACTSSCSNNAQPNMLFYQVPSNTNDPNFNKTTDINLAGVVYMPGASVNLNKSLGNGSVVIFGSANFNKGTYNFAGPGLGSLGAKKAILGE